MNAIRPHPENPRYFLFRGKPAVLITATEHYGSATNGDFDYLAYLDMLREYGFNLTRLVLTLRESPTEFGGCLGYQNTLCPTDTGYIGPWVRSDEPGHRDGCNKLDLMKWNEAFFARLKGFCAEAANREIVVEVTFYSQCYSDKPDSPWSLCPMNGANNVNGVGAAAFNRYNSCESQAVLAVQETFVRRVAETLARYDNVYYEICNEPPYPEPYDPDPMPPDHAHSLGEQAISRWQNHLARAILDTEEALDCRHMIAVGDPHESIDFNLFSVYNYHYRQWMEKGLAMHGGHGKVMAFDETLTGIVSWNREMDFDGRRREAWEFMMRGVAVYDYLDFTVATGDPRGEGHAEFPDGKRFDGTMMRVYLRHLKTFMDSVDFTHMQPDHSLIAADPEPACTWALANPGREYAAYLWGSAVKALPINLPRGRWCVQWYNPLTGKVDKVEECEGGNVGLELPLYQMDIALRITKIHFCRSV